MYRLRCGGVILSHDHAGAGRDLSQSWPSTARFVFPCRQQLEAAGGRRTGCRCRASIAGCDHRRAFAVEHGRQVCDAWRRDDVAVEQFEAAGGHASGISRVARRGEIRSESPCVGHDRPAATGDTALLNSSARHRPAHTHLAASYLNRERQLCQQQNLFANPSNAVGSGNIRGMSLNPFKHLQTIFP